MISKALLRVWVLIALVVSGAGAVQAQTFNFSYTSSGVGVMGTFVTTSQGNGRYLINNILNGIRGGNAIALISPNGYGGNDNILVFPANPAYFDTSGLAYSSNGTSYKITSFGPNYLEQTNTATIFIADVMVASVPAPLPGGGLLSFLALGLAGLIYRRSVILTRSRAVLALFRVGPAVGPA